MKFLIIGLGSMGKRRARCLIRLGVPGHSIVGFDVREDRREEASGKYGISTVAELTDDIWAQTDAVIVSTPPDRHLEYINLCIIHRKPVFVEASVILKGLAEANSAAKNENVLIAPSCTFLFHPIVKEIAQLVKNGVYGRATNFSYHSGQYLPDWHPWEDVKDFYVSQKETGGAREIVPFELTWLTEVFGYPCDVKGFWGRTMDLGCEIDDTYAIALDFGHCFGTMVVDVVSRRATRKLILNLEQAQVFWDWDEKAFRVYEASAQKERICKQPDCTSEAGYNANIIEEMYIDELKSFIDAVKGANVFPNSLDKDIKVLELLQKVEGGVLP